MASNAYVIADLHLDQDSITKFRPQFETKEEHDKFIIEQINKVVNPSDSLYLLGDIVIGPGGWESLSQLRCQNLYLIPGNHCGERTSIKCGMFKRLTGAYSRRLPRSRLSAVFTHIPVHPDCLDRWQVNIHGHLHKKTIKDPRYLCVSCEAINYTPITMEDVFYHYLALKWADKLQLPDGLFQRNP